MIWFMNLLTIMKNPKTLHQLKIALTHTIEMTTQALELQLAQSLEKRLSKSMITYQI